MILQGAYYCQILSQFACECYKIHISCCKYQMLKYRWGVSKELLPLRSSVKLISMFSYKRFKHFDNNAKLEMSPIDILLQLDCNLS